MVDLVQLEVVVYTFWFFLEDLLLKNLEDLNASRSLWIGNVLQNCNANTQTRVYEQLSNIVFQSAKSIRINTDMLPRPVCIVSRQKILLRPRGVDVAGMSGAANGANHVVESVGGVVIFVILNECSSFVESVGGSDFCYINTELNL